MSNYNHGTYVPMTEEEISSIKLTKPISKVVKSDYYDENGDSTDPEKTTLWAEKPIRVFKTINVGPDNHTSTCVTCGEIGFKYFDMDVSICQGCGHNVYDRSFNKKKKRYDVQS